MATEITNPAILARQAVARANFKAATDQLDAARKQDLADAINTADGNVLSVEDALAAIDKAD